METLPKRTVVDTLHASQEYASRLEGLLEAINNAESQVENSSQTASQHLQSAFEQIELTISAAIAVRKEALLKLVQDTRRKVSAPLNLCRAEIINKIETNKFLISEAEAVLASGGFTSPENCTNFLKKSSALGSLPAVPEAEYIPNITFVGSTNDILQSLKDEISRFGTIYQIGPVQITDLHPKPGALLIKWENNDSEIDADVLQYKLEMALGDVRHVENLFRTVYVGPETEFLVTDLSYQEKYSFRVCLGNSILKYWSPWSFVKTSVTNIPPYTWDSTNGQFRLSDNGRLAKALLPHSILFSNGPQIESGNSVQFTIFCSPEPMVEEGVGIAVGNVVSERSLVQPGIFFVSFHGHVYIDGVKKLISLPKMSKGDKITFGCELMNGKWRVNVESSCKVVTYDWAARSCNLFFATSLSQPDVQILVE